MCARVCVKFHEIVCMCTRWKHRTEKNRPSQQQSRFHLARIGAANCVMFCVFSFGCLDVWCARLADARSPQNRGRSHCAPPRDTTKCKPSWLRASWLRFCLCSPVKRAHQMRAHTRAVCVHKDAEWHMYRNLLCAILCTKIRQQPLVNAAICLFALFLRTVMHAASMGSLL